MVVEWTLVDRTEDTRYFILLHCLLLQTTLICWPGHHHHHQHYHGHGHHEQHQLRLRWRQSRIPQRGTVDKAVEHNRTEIIIDLYLPVCGTMMTFLFCFSRNIHRYMYSFSTPQHLPEVVIQNSFRWFFLYYRSCCIAYANYPHNICLTISSKHTTSLSDVTQAENTRYCSIFILSQVV